MGEAGEALQPLHVRELVAALERSSSVLPDELVGHDMFPDGSRVVVEEPPSDLSVAQQRAMVCDAVAKSVGRSDWLQVLAGLAALAGHIWPVWLGWKGGKAVATGLGMFLGLAWPVGLACFCLFMAVISIFRIVSLSSVVAAIGLPLLMLTSGGSSAYVVVSLVASLMVLWRHRSNIERLIAGTEPRIGAKAR